MSRSIRIHLKIESGRSPATLWTFDNPREISIGFQPTCSVWVFDPAAGPKHVLFRRRGAEVRLRVDKGFKGDLTLDRKIVPMSVLRDAGALRKDREGEYVALKEKTEGSLFIGTTSIQFWISLSPAEPEFPVHPLVLRLFSSIPKGYVFAFFLASLMQFGVYRVIRNLPPGYMPSIDEVDRTVSRLLIPSPDYLSKISRPEAPIEKAVENAKEKRVRQPQTTGGLLAAVSRPKVGGKSSPFQNLFSSTSITGDLNQALKGQSLDSYMAKQLNKGTGLDLATSPQTVDVSVPKVASAQASTLSKDVSGPNVARFSMDLPEVQGVMRPELLSNVVTENVGQLRDCYERGLARRPEMSGKVVLRLVITTEGKPTSVNVEESTLRDPAVERCIVTRVSLWTFPRPQGGATPVRFPFIFSSASRG